jgi:hypothetical protein
MKNVFKVLGIIALAAVIGFGVMACKDDDDGGDGDGGGGKEPKFTGTVTAVEGMGVRFEFNGSSSASGYDSCTFTTDLASPNNSFKLGGSSYGDDKTIPVSAGTPVIWSAAVTVVSGSTTTYEKVEESGLVKIQRKY